MKLMGNSKLAKRPEVSGCKQVVKKLARFGVSDHELETLIKRTSEKSRKTQQKNWIPPTVEQTVSVRSLLQT